MTLEQLLNESGIDVNNSRIKIARHTINRKHVKKVIEIGEFELYQEIQKKNIFKEVDYLISFIGSEGTKAILHGVYEVKGWIEIDEIPEEIIFIRTLEEWGNSKRFKYELKKIDVLKNLEKKLVIDWGNSTRAWQQRKLNKEIVEILP